MTDATLTRLEFRADTERRIVSGIVVPWDRVAWSGGRRWRFRRGSVVWPQPVSRVKLLLNHDSQRPVGPAVRFEDHADGLFGEFKIARIPDGDLALRMIEDGASDGFSIAPNLEKATARLDRSSGDVVTEVSSGARLVEVSLTPTPAYDDARVLAGAERYSTAPCTDDGGVATCFPEPLAVEDEPAGRVVMTGSEPGVGPAWGVLGISYDEPEPGRRSSPVLLDFEITDFMRSWSMDRVHEDEAAARARYEQRRQTAPTHVHLPALSIDDITAPVTDEDRRRWQLEAAQRRIDERREAEAAAERRRQADELGHLGCIDPTCVVCTRRHSEQMMERMR